MPGMLARSRSLRFLKNTRKDVQEQETEGDLPMQPQKTSQTAFDKSRSATPVLGAESRLAPPDLEVRPNTSGGPGDRSTMMFHMKTSPLPAFQSSEHVPYRSSPMPSTTTLSTTGSPEEQGVIGIALGSPTVGSHWVSTPPTASSTTDYHGAVSGMQTHIYSDGVSSDRQYAAKSKLSRWKSLFRKAAPPPPPPRDAQKPSFYQLAQSVATTVPRADSHHDDESPMSTPQDRPGHMIEAMRTVSPPTYKPDIRASRKGAPDGFIVPQSPDETPATRTRALTLGDLTANTRPHLKVQRAFTTPNQPSTGNASSLTGTPLLDVNIPDVKMDRYSVMFGNLLQTGSSRSSLLARRQVNAERLKPLTQLVANDIEKESPPDYKLSRRATSPTVPAASPRLSLFPSASTSRAPSPLSHSANRGKMQRSRTAPAKSPRHHTFQAAEKKQGKTVSSMLNPASSQHLQPALTPTSVHSFESDTDSVTIVVAQATPFKVQLDEREPEWEMCPKITTEVKHENASVTSFSDLSRTASQRQPTLTKLSALSSHPSSAPLDAPSPLQRLQSLKSPALSARRAGEKRTASESRDKTVGNETQATVGVARSISVSRANSPRAIKRTMTDIGNVTSPERLVERQALTPTMVEVRNRKSQRVQVEMMV